MLFPTSPPPCLAPASCFQGCSSHPSLSFCLSPVTVGIQQWHFWVGDRAPETCEAEAALLESLPIACTPGLCSPSPFGHKSSQKCGELSAAALCKAQRCLQPPGAFPCLSPPISLWGAGLPPTLPQGMMDKLMRAGRTGLCWLFPLQPLCWDLAASD